MTHEAVSSEITIDAPRERILGVLCDFESYPAWARSVKDARVLRTDEEGRAVRKFAMGRTSKKYDSVRGDALEAQWHGEKRHR